MIQGLGPYHAYRESGISWLGEVPEHWEVKRGKVLWRCVDVRSEAGHEELLTVSSDRGVVPRSSATVTMFKAESYAGYKLCWPGDLVVNSLWAWSGGLGVSRHHGIVSSAYGVYRLRPPHDDYSAYMHELVRSQPFNWELRVQSRGIWISRLQLTDERFLGVSFPVPPPDEQAAIVRFLNWVDRRVSRVIRARQRRIELLEEYKRVLIHRVVTGQIDVGTGRPYPTYKPSDVEWLGELPEHWVVVPLKCAARVQTGITLGKNYGRQRLVERPYLRVANVQMGRLDLQTVKTIAVPPHEVDGSELLPGDVLMTEGGDIDKLGRGCMWRGEIEGCLHQNHIFAVRPDQARLLPDYLVALMASQHGRTYFELTAKRTTNLASTNSTTLRAFPLLLQPPDEQRRIVDFVAVATRELDDAVGRTTREIMLLNEFRTRLIADVVTGKLDVREIAAKLPGELPKDEMDGPAEEESSEAVTLTVEDLGSTLEEVEA